MECGSCFDYSVSEIQKKMLTHIKIGWLIYAITSIFFSILLAARPIPTLASSNDTGRYVADFIAYCNNKEVYESSISQIISYKIFYFFTAASCVGDLKRLFLFQIAFLTPIVFLLFSKWTSGTLPWSLGLLISVFGLELMTNAMRQNLAMFLLFYAIFLIQRNTRLSILFGLLSVFAHASAAVFFPLFLLLRGSVFPKNSRLILVLLIFILILLGIYFLNEMGVYDIFFNFYNFYEAIYRESLNLNFIIFMIFPLYIIFGLRFFLERKFITLYEKKAIAYSTLLLIICFLLFPAIIYRFAIFAVTLQIFLITLASRQNLLTGMVALALLFAHSLFMLIASNNYYALIYE
jgi:EpsG family